MMRRGRLTSAVVVLVASLAWGTAAALLEPTLGNAGSSVRETVSFNFGWRFKLGDPQDTEPRCTDTSFDLNATQGCSNMVYAPLKSEFDCWKACCPGSGYHPNCVVWQYAEQQWINGTGIKGCYLGSASAVCPGNSSFPSSVKWSGGKRTSAWPLTPTYTYGQRDFADAGWEIVDVPHDFVIEGEFNASARDNGQHGYLPRDQPGWYRKHFNIPLDWRNDSVAVTLRFNGVYHVSEAWLNGAPLALTAGSKSGYTSFTADIPQQVKQLEQQHVLALRVDASYGSGHWYEGGGIYRDCFIEASSTILRIEEHGLFVSTNGSTAFPAASIANIQTAYTVEDIQVRFSLYDANDFLAAPHATTPPTSIGPGETAVLRLPFGLLVDSPELWSVQSPSLYTLVAAVLVGERLIDSVNATFGFRTALFTADSGFSLNGHKLILRGFSNHNDMAGVGAAVPQRLNLFRAQMLRGLGGNTWRMSHNPGDPATFDILDRLGILSWDENRDYGRFQVADMVDMVRRDRNHPSIVVWSLCNEIECTEGDGSEGSAFRTATLQVDNSRPISANLLHDSSGSMIDHLDVVGISHVSTLPSPWTPTPAKWYDPRYSFDWFHNKHPNVSLVSSESTSCNTQRGPNVVNTTAGAWDDVFNADCLSKQFCPPNVSKGGHINISGHSHNPGSCTQSWTMAYNNGGSILPYMGGHLGIWTLMDYLGEPSSQNRADPCTQNKNKKCHPNWPQVSCNFGSFDLAGFPKPAASWYRAWWLSDIAEGDVSRPPIGNATALVKIVHDWNLPAPPVVAVYSNLPTIELFLNGQSLGHQQMGWANWTQWSPKFVPGNLTAVGYNKEGDAVARDTSMTVGAPAGITMSLDAPSLDTGTGSALLLDGQDAALVRVSVVDVQGRLVTDTNNLKIDFKVISGPGRVIGVGNGDPTSHEPNKASTRKIHYGLARAVVQASINAATIDRARMAQIDAEGSIRTKVYLDNQTDRAFSDGAIVLEATAVATSGDAFQANTQIKIPVSSDFGLHDVKAVASRSAVLEHLRID